MERQGQKSIEMLESQISESLERPQEKSCITSPYRAPQIFLVGTAKRLVTGGSGDYYDATQYYYTH